MARYGAEVIGWWNEAYHSMKEDGTFRQLCMRSQAAHSKSLTVRGRPCINDLEGRKKSRKNAT